MRSFDVGETEMIRVWRLWTTVVVVVVSVVCVNAELSELTEAWSCYDGALQSASSNPPLAGGYQEVVDPSNDEDVMSVSQLAMARLNSVADNNYIIDTTTNDGLIAFQQVSSLKPHLHWRL